MNNKLWLQLMRGTVVRRYTGITSMIEAVQCGFDRTEAVEHVKYQIKLHRAEMDRVVHDNVQRVIKNHTRPQPLPLP